MTTATMTSKGQITVPRDVREDLGLVAGSKVMFVKLGPRDYRIVARTGRIEDLFGILHRPGQRPLTIEEMNEGIAEAAAESGMRGVRNEP
ncbi:AbrB/MazE/SpoVT family DNA-binding domain-containing protein [Microlunatus speluncae]|uniref:AbrB/MazE/SpoVT family DNA-binding domain-containing protein n=1 Tax=Microlunatus speluncae TaxID=2594267 RepID=UPI001266127C|nr:AbrB/MazE/SpoVT family DNA-binding domain-containing protein [Microlunatus speluncae]